MTAWRLNDYPPSLNQSRVQSGTDRCQSSGTTYALHEIVANGLVTAPLTGDPLTTPPPRTRGVWIFAVKGTDMRLAPDGGARKSGKLPRQAVKHETLFHNQPVAAAGEICISGGIIVDVNEMSGTYAFAFDDHFKGAVSEAIERAGATASSALREKLA